MVMMMMMMMNGLQKQIRTHEDVPNKVSTGEGGGYKQGCGRFPFSDYHLLNTSLFELCWYWGSGGRQNQSANVSKFTGQKKMSITLGPSSVTILTKGRTLCSMMMGIFKIIL